MTDLSKVYGRDPNYVSRRIEDETILVPIRNTVGDLDSIYSLNSVGAFIWERLDGAADLQFIRDVITREYEIDAVAAETDLVTFIDQLDSIAAIRPVG